MMTDARLQALYRRLHATRIDIPTEDLVEAIDRHGYADVEGTALDRIATSNPHADILRTAMELAPDAQALARDVAALRQVPRARPAMRRMAALAAGVAALGIVVVMQRSADTGAMPESLPENEVILSASFESPATMEQITMDQMEIDEARPIFRGDFDS